MSGRSLREQIVDLGKLLFNRRYTSGSSGNTRIRTEEGSRGGDTDHSGHNCCLGELRHHRNSLVDWNGRYLARDPPSNEAFLHLAVYRQRREEGAIVHLHSTWSVAGSYLKDVDGHDLLPSITAYYVLCLARWSVAVDRLVSAWRSKPRPGRGTCRPDRPLPPPG